MKKIITFLIVLFSLSSCYYSWDIHDYNYMQWNSYSDTCSISNTEFVAHCNVNQDSTEFYFIKKEHNYVRTDTFAFSDKIYLLNRDSIVINRESYKYDPYQFKQVLIEKNSIPRDTTVFKFTPEMYMTWRMFDEIYNTYIK